jgi:hypothetical protein
MTAVGALTVAPILEFDVIDCCDSTPLHAQKPSSGRSLSTVSMIGPAIAATVFAASILCS